MVKKRYKRNKNKMTVSKIKTDNLLKITSRKIFTVSSLLLLTLGLNNEAKAATLDDLRELLGDERIEDRYSEKEREDIMQKYKKIEENNRIFNLYEPDTVQLLNKRVLEEKAKFQKLIKQKEAELIEAFNSSKTPEEIIAIRSAINNLQYQKNAIRDTHDIMDIKYIENDVELEYKNVVTVVEELESYEDLGEVGSHLASPLIDAFMITSPFGYRIHPIRGTLEMHNGIDIAGKTGKPVYAQWNGVVSRVYSTATGGLSIEIDHGNNTLTRYLHLNKQIVKEGQQVDQYTQIGEVGATGAVTGAHLHFEVLINSEYVNPIYFYGRNGAKMLNNYIMTTDDPYHQSMKNIVYQIKEDPEWLVKYRKENKPSYEPGERDVDIIYPSIKPIKGAKEVKLQEGYEFSKPSAFIR